MSAQSIITHGVAIIFGAVVGIVVGKTISDKNHEKEVELINEAHKRLTTADQFDPEEIIERRQEEERKVRNGLSDFVNPAKIATEGQPGIDYTKYVKMVKDTRYASEAEHPTDSDEDPEEEDDNYMETYDDRVARESREAMEKIMEYKNKHKGRIDMITREEYDTDFPEVDYDHEELWYFKEEDILANEDGDILRFDHEFVGNIFDKIGFRTNDDKEIYIRNNPMEKDFWIHKEWDSYEDYYG